MRHRATAIRLLRVAAALLLGAAAIAAVGCGARKPRALMAPATAVDPRVGVWLRADSWSRPALDKAQARRYFETIAAHGTGTVFLELKTRTGEPLFAIEPPTAPMPDPLGTAIDAARGCGLRVVGVLPVTVGAPADDAERRVAYEWDAAANLARLAPAKPGGGEPDRRTPIAPTVADIEAARCRALGRYPFEAVCLSHIGFGSMATDFSPGARHAFEAAMGLTIRSWPEDVVAFEPAGEPGAPPRAVRGPLWPSFVQWRAGEVRALVFRLESALSAGAREAGRDRIPLVLFADASYPLHDREGANWALSAGEGARAYPEMPGAYAATSCAGALDGVVLNYGAPIPTAAEAQAEGFVWWASVEGASKLARMVFPSRAMQWGALSPFPFAGQDGVLDPAERERFARALSAATAGNDAVVLVDSEYLDRWSLWPGQPADNAQK